jgi:hypothetical protein
MLSRQKKVQNQLFYSAINLEQRVRKDHILRKVKIHIDLILSTMKSKTHTALTATNRLRPLLF